MNNVEDKIPSGRPPLKVLEQIKALSQEHFDDYLLVLMKDSVRSLKASHERG